MSLRLRIVLGVLAIPAAVGIVVATRSREAAPVAPFFVFHWIPGSTPLKVLGTPPLAPQQGAEMSDWLGPELTAALNSAGISGELRLLGYFHLTDPGKTRRGAILLHHKPLAPFTLGLVDSATIVYREQQSGFSTFPQTGRSTGDTLTLSPGRNAQAELLHVTGPGATVRGAAGIWWW